VIIPTFWTRRRGRLSDNPLTVYDHPTPIDSEGTLPACLRSLEDVEGLGRVVVIVAATDPGIEHAAEDKVREILADVPGIDALVFGPAELGSLHRRLEQVEFADMIGGVSLVGYGAVRNVGLIAAAVLGCESVVFVDDDQIITDKAFLTRAMEGIGARLDDGRVVLAKSGFYTDEEGRHQWHAPPHWSNMFWRQNEVFNQALAIVDAPPRIKVSPLAFGGCFALHRDIFVNVSFDPWVMRGEDIDYVINARMHGGDVFLDGEWSVIHNPPKLSSEALQFRQDVYRFIYEQRKIEFAKSQVDLRQVTTESMMPYPGQFIGSSVTWRAMITAILRGVSHRAEGGRYFKVARTALKDASAYARENCQNYFDFQRRWPMLMDRIWDDIALKSLFTGERTVDRSAITGRFPSQEDV
jgi:GT2 family glycosyltransferase